MARPLILALALAAPLAAFAAPVAPVEKVQQDVDYLLGYIARSGCDFYRNGSWSDATAAEAHVRTKYNFLVRHDNVASAADFIEKAASKSSITGMAYQVKCAGSAPVLSSAWLNEALARHKDSASAVQARK